MKEKEVDKLDVNMDRITMKLRRPTKAAGGKKRADIQYLRCVAIVAVLGFHSRPDVVPQGFLGVDIFFVISGYLMTLILNFFTNKTLTVHSILKFYERRLKRLLPAYLIIIFLTLFICGFCLISIDFDFLRADALWATLFGTNLQSIFEKKTYFYLVSDYKFLLHTWSLSVEIQYYLLAPFLTYFIHKSGYRLIATSGGILVSLLFQILTYEHESVSFGAVFSRIWQFLIGTFVYYYEKEEIKESPVEEDAVNLLEDGEKPSPAKFKYPCESPLTCIFRTILFVSLIAVMFMSVLSDSFTYKMGIRILSTVLTGLIMYCRWTHSSNFVSKLFIYFGDISYSVYLVHWPLIVLAKYMLLFEYWSLFHLFVLIFALSVLQYELFERKLLQATNKRTFGTCLVIILGIGLLGTQQQGLGYISKAPVHPAVAGNEKIASSCNHLEELFDCNWDPEIMKGIVNKPTKAAAFYCSFDGPGEATVYFTGNSFALRQLPAVKKAFEGKYKKFYFVARPACLTFEVFNVGYDKYWQCDEIMNKTQVFLERLKPDILIITEKMAGSKQFSGLLSVEQAKNHTTVKVVSEYFEKFSQYVKKIFVIEPHPTVGYNPPTTLAKAVAQGRSLEGYIIPMSKVQKDVDPGWNKILAAMLTCPKCEPIHLRKKTCSKDSCPVYEKDTKLSLFCDNSHLSQHGAERMIPVMKPIFTKTLKELGYKV